MDPDSICWTWGFLPYSLVLKVGLQQARGISKAAETGEVLHVQVRKDRLVKIILAEE